MDASALIFMGQLNDVITNNNYAALHIIHWQIMTLYLIWATGIKRVSDNQIVTPPLRIPR